MPDIDEQEQLNILLDKFYVDRDDRAQYEPEVLRSYKQLLAWTKDLPAGETRSNLNIPKTYKQVDTTRARQMKATFNTSPFVEFKPKVSKDSDPVSKEANTAKGKLAAALVNQQLEKNEMVLTAWDFYTSMAFSKGAILSVGWRYETKTVKKWNQNRKEVLNSDGTVSYINFKEFAESDEVVWDDNEISNIDWFDFWPDSRGKNWNPNSWRHAWHQDWMTKKQIEDRLEALKKLGYGTVYPMDDDDWNRLRNASDELRQGRVTRLAEVGKSGDVLDGEQFENNGDATDSTLYEVLNYWTGEDYAMIIAQTKLAYYGGTPYQRHKMIPFVFIPYDPLPNEVQGRSYCDWLYHLQEEINTNRNQRIDNRALITNQQWTTTDDSLPDRIMSKPGRVHKVSEQGALQSVPVVDTTGVSVQEEEILSRDMEETMGTPAIVQGVQTEGNPTATEISTQNGNASARFDVRINFLHWALKRLYRLMDMNNQQFMTDSRLLEVADENGVMQWKQITPDDIAGEWDYYPAGPNVDPYANKEAKRNAWLQYLDICKKYGLNVDEEYINRQILDTFDVANKEKAIPEQPPQPAPNPDMVKLQIEQDKNKQDVMIEQQKMMVDLVKTLISIYPKIAGMIPINPNELGQLGNTNIEEILQTEGANQQPAPQGQEVIPNQ